MSDLISRKLISDYLREQHAQVIIEKYKDGFITDDVCKGMECSIDAFVNFISQCPTVDAVPVVHAEWIDIQPDYHSGFYGNAHKCSNCNDYYTTEYDDLFFYPRCGAKMDGKKVEK